MLRDDDPETWRDVGWSSSAISMGFSPGSVTARTMTVRDSSDLFSVIMPSHNHERYIRRAVESVLMQTYEKWELIVIDDGSSDGSLGVLATVRDPRVVLFSQTNHGAHAAINKGLELAKGEFITILNSDDMYLPCRLERMRAEFDAQRDSALVTTWTEVIDAEDRHLAVKRGWENLEPWPLRHPDASYKQTNDFRLNLLASNFVATTSNIAFRRSLYERIGGMRNLRFTHDWDFLLRASLAGTCRQISEPLLRYRVHDRNTIATDRRGMLFEICWVLAANLDGFLGKHILSSMNDDALLEEIVMLYESINLQGNDKLFWLIRTFIESQRKMGHANPEEILLHHAALREMLMSFVVVDPNADDASHDPRPHRPYGVVASLFSMARHFATRR